MHPLPQHHAYYKISSKNSDYIKFKCQNFKIITTKLKYTMRNNFYIILD